MNEFNKKSANDAERKSVDCQVVYSLADLIEVWIEQMQEAREILKQIKGC